MKVLVITNLFPNNKEPNRGVFIKQQMLELTKLCELQVVAPVAWHRARGILQEELHGTPGHHDTSLSRAKSRETQGLKVYHPRYFMIPKIGRSLYGFFFYLGIIGKVKEIYREFKFDIVLSPWAYPDGFASALIAKILRKPLIINVLGSDVNLLTKYFLRRKMITYAFRRAEKIISVSRDLKEKIIKLGISERKIEVISNGIDTDLFKPMDKIECRERLNLPIDKKIILFVGNLEIVKGVDILLDAMKDLPKNINLVVVGDGSLRRDTKTQRHKDTGLKDRIIFYGARPHNEIPIWMNASDVFCLPSRNEGCPNVILEALACGRPIVASRVGGIPEIIKSEEQGILVSPGNVSEITAGIKKALAKKWTFQVLRQSGAHGDWAENAKKIHECLTSITKKRNILYHHRTQGTGAEGVHIANIIKGFRKLGHKVYVVSPPGVDPEKTAGGNPYGGKKGAVSKFFGFISRRLPQFLFEALEILYNAKAYCNLQRVISKHRVDFIYERSAFFLFAGVRIAKKYNIPIIVEVNEVVGEKRVRKQHFIGLAGKIERYVFKNADTIIVVSEFLKNKISEYGVDRDKIFVMPNAVDEAVFFPNPIKSEMKKHYAIENGALVIGFIGWFVAWHDIELLIDVFSKIAKETEAFLFLAGDGVLKNRFKDMVRERAIENKVIFPGAIPYEHITDYIDLMDICVVPGSNEYRSPIKLFEYMAMSKAVVAPRYKAIESIIENGIDGVLFDPGNGLSLQEALETLVKNPEKRQSLGKMARKKVLENHTWLSNSKKILEIYDR